jgi:hypothetical protein
MFEKVGAQTRTEFADKLYKPMEKPEDNNGKEPKKQE